MKTLIINNELRCGRCRNHSTVAASYHYLINNAWSLPNLLSIVCFRVSIRYNEYELWTRLEWSDHKVCPEPKHADIIIVSNWFARASCTSFNVLCFSLKACGEKVRDFCQLALIGKPVCNATSRCKLRADENGRAWLGNLWCNQAFLCLAGRNLKQQVRPNPRKLWPRHYGREQP